MRPTLAIFKNLRWARDGRDKRAFFIWNLPIIWTIISTFSFFVPGENYQKFENGTIVGAWVSRVFTPESLSGSLFPVLGIGVIVLLMVGFIMDSLRVSKPLWSVLFILGGVLLFAISASQQSFREMNFQHGSVLAVVLYDVNFGLYIAIALSSVLTAVKRLFERIFRRNPKA